MLLLVLKLRADCVRTRHRRGRGGKRGTRGGGWIRAVAASLHHATSLISLMGAHLFSQTEDVQGFRLSCPVDASHSVPVPSVPTVMVDSGNPCLRRALLLLLLSGHGCRSGCVTTATTAPAYWAYTKCSNADVRPPSCFVARTVCVTAAASAQSRHAQVHQPRPPHAIGLRRASRLPNILSTWRGGQTVRRRQLGTSYHRQRHDGSVAKLSHHCASVGGDVSPFPTHAVVHPLPLVLLLWLNCCCCSWCWCWCWCWCPDISG
jgi:hypothetical protein